MRSLSFGGIRGAGYVVISRLLVMAVGLAITILAPFKLTSSEQGFFFTFLSLAALQGLFELGISRLIIQSFAHLRGEVESSHNSSCVLNVDTKLIELDFYSSRYFTSCAILFCTFVGAGGSLFFIVSSGVDKVSAWFGPWVMLVIGTGMSLRNISEFSVIEGFGTIHDAYKIRIVSTLILFLVYLTVVLIGGALYAHPTALLVSQIYVFKQANKVKKTLLPRDHAGIGAKKFDFGELKKTQRRFAVSAIAGYFTANSITPYVFYFFGADVAGRVGLTVSVFFAAASLAMAFSTADAPSYGRLIAQGKYCEVFDAWKGNVRYSLLSVAFFVLLFLFGYYLLKEFNPDYLNRILGVKAFLILGALIAVNTTLTTVSTVLRAFRLEDLMWPSVWAAVVSIVLQVVFHVSPEDYFVGMAAYNGLFFLPLAYFLMRKKLSS